MLRLFCCQSRRTSRVEADRITDSLESCLSSQLGVEEFLRFLISKKFEEHRRTLEFALKCESVLVDIKKLSSGTRAGELPDNIRNAIHDLHEMTADINFTFGQMQALENLQSPDINKKVQALQDAQNWATSLLQDIYKVFRREALR